ncbi:MAG: hypothetical protein ACFFDW_01190 [Candidatus Thorarchaeota archaeon]
MIKINPRILSMMIFILSFLVIGGITIGDSIAPPSGGISPGDDGTGGGGS